MFECLWDSERLFQFFFADSADCNGGSGQQGAAGGFTWSHYSWSSVSVNDACWENRPRAAVTSAQVSGGVGFWDVLRLRCVTWPCCSTGSTSLSWEQETKQEPGSLLVLSVYMKLIIRLSIINEPMSLTPLKSDFFKVHPKTLNLHRQMSLCLEVM